MSHSAEPKEPKEPDLLSLPPLPAQNRHGLPVVLAPEQLVNVGVQHGQRELEDDLDAVVEEAVHHHHGALEGHDGQEEGEEPGERDGGDDAEVLHAVVQLRDVLAGQLLEHALIHQGSCRADAEGGRRDVKMMVG